jgi:ribonuclease HI
VYDLQFDGLFRRIGENTKTGVMAYGWLIYHNEIVIARGYGVFAARAEATSNVAEYLALIEGLTALQDMGVQTEPIKISGDSKIVISQMNGQSAIHAEQMKELHQQAAALASAFEHLRFEWRKRSHNKEADLLSRHALKQAKKNQRHYNAVVERLATSRGYYRSRRSTLIESFQPLVALAIFRRSGLAM